MFGFSSRRNFSNTSQQVLSGLIVVIIVWLSLIAIDVKAQTPSNPANPQTSLNPANPNVEDFFDSQYRNFAKCIKELYLQDNNQIRYLDGNLYHLIGRPEYTKYKIDVFKQRCTNLGIDIGVNLNNPTIVENFQKVAHCLDEIYLINNVGWNQEKPERLESCFFVTKNTLGPSRQAYIDCMIRAKYNPQTKYLDKNNENLQNLCLRELETAFVFPKNIINNNYLQHYSYLLYCLDHNRAKPKFRTASWDWEGDGHQNWVGGFWDMFESPNCRWFIYDFSQLRMKTPSELGIPLFGGGDQISLPDLNFNPIIIEIPTEQTCWISKEDKNAGPNLTNIWNPGNWLPIMYNCQNTTNGRPIPLHPINFIPIAIRLFAFITSLLIWLIILNLVIGIILFIVGVATSILAWVKKILIGSVAVVIVLISMYLILYFILSIFQG